MICKASGLLFLLEITTTFYRRDLYESRLALGLFLVLNICVLTLARRGVWLAVKYLRRRGLNYGRALIIGSGRIGRTVAKTIHNNRWTGLEAIGYVDRDARPKTNWLPRLGDIAEIAEVIQRHEIDHVMLALPLSRYGELPGVYSALSNLVVEVHLVPDVPHIAGMNLQSLEVDDVAFLGLRQSPHYGWAKVVKRAMDLSLGTVILACCLRR